jgi:hypothetical protein
MGNSFVLHPFPQPYRLNVIRLLGLTNENIHRLKAEDLDDDRLVGKLEK